MGFNTRGFLFALVLVAVAAELVGNAAAATYVVGDSLGWTVPNSAADYTNWATQHVFALGDVLVFNFTTGQHNVAQVTKASYDSCSGTNPLSVNSVGPSNITLRSAGQTYYICTFGSHCSLGQKLAINTTASSTTPTPAPAPAPSSTATPTLAPAPTPTSTLPGSPAPAPAPATATPPPSPSPSGDATPSPGLPPSSTTPPESLSPPPPPSSSSATISTTSASMLGFAFIAIGLMI